MDQTTKRSMSSLAPAERDDIACRYQSGETLTQLGGRYRMHVELIARVLERQGIPRRSRSDYRQRSIDVAAFAEPTPEAAYWIGFLMADGSITCGTKSGRCRYCVELGLSSVDEDHVEAFKRFVSSSAPTRRRKQPIGDGHLSTVTISSLPLVKVLMSFGVTPTKNTDGVATDSLRTSRDFWRGVVDGDGSIGIHPRRGGFRPALTLLGSGPLMQQFAAFVRSIIPTYGGNPCRLRQCKSTYQVSLSSRMATIVIDRVYTGANLALARKLVIASRVSAEFSRWLLPTAV